MNNEFNGKKNETKREKFVRIAELRVNNILDQFRKLSNLSNSNNYEFNEKDIKKIFSTLNKELVDTKKKFLNENVENKKKFKLEV